MQDIKDYLSYDPLTGLFTRIKDNHRWKAGSVVGCKLPSGYVNIGFNYKVYKAHRLAWYFTYGYFPDCDVDHRNESKDDNRLENLRLDTNKENQQNISSLRCDNASGFIGVYWLKLNKCWVAQIKIKGKRKHLGYYDTPEGAHAAYLCAKREYHPFWIENK